MLAQLSVAAMLAVAGHDDHASHAHQDAQASHADYMSALPDSAICIQGVGYPMFRTQALSDAATSLGVSHSMKVGHLDKYTVYMPNGDYPGKVMCAHDDHSSSDDHSGHDHSRLLSETSKCTCPPSGATGPVVDATKIIKLPMTAFCIEGYYPMYATLSLSNAASPKGTSHAHKHTASDGTVYTLHMPNGVQMVHDTKCDAKYDDQTAALAVGTGPSTAVIGGAIGGSVGGVALIGAIAAFLKFKVFAAKSGAATIVKASATEGAAVGNAA
jgi:hypothetical protein